MGSNGFGGGLVGSNSGTITNAFATGEVTGAAGSNGFTTLGGLTAVNLELDFEFFRLWRCGKSERCRPSGRRLGRQQCGYNTSSVAKGNVQAGDGSIAGGLVASNLVNNSIADSGTITGSQATGNVTVGAASVAGGLVGASDGTIREFYRLGAVSSTGADSIIGGLVGASTGAITDSTASGAVSGTGADSIIGGLVGASAGTLTDSTASGAVSSTGANSTVGGLVGRQRRHH